jgi:cell division protein FtsW
MTRRPKGKQERTIKYFDYTLLFIIIFLVCFGLVMLYSTSSYNAQLKYHDGAYYLKKQIFATCLGFAAMYIISKIDYHVWVHFAGIA